MVVLCGRAVAANHWIHGLLEAHAYAVVAEPCLDELPRQLRVHDTADIVLELSAQTAADVLTVLRIASRRDRRRILIASWKPDWSLIRSCSILGTGDFVRLPCAASEFLLRLEMLARERAEGFAESVDQLTAEPTTLHPIVELAGAPRIRFTDREYALYCLLAERFESVVTRTEILQHVWGRQPEGALVSNVIDVYVSYVRAKIAEAGLPLQIRTVRHAGYVLERRARVSGSSL